MSRKPIPIETRLWSKVDKSAPGGCWNWTGLTLRGYGQIAESGGVAKRPKRHRVHRLVYQMLIAPIPDGLVIDHLCRNTVCVNPAQLEPVTDRVNLLRGRTLAAANAKKTHCKQGHPFDETNTYHYISRGNPSRGCKAGKRDYSRRWKTSRPH